MPGGRFISSARLWGDRPTRLAFVMGRNVDIREYHRRVAGRLRSLLTIARASDGFRAQLIRKIEKHERLARVFTGGSLSAAGQRWG
jgi:hypothetical protein